MKFKMHGKEVVLRGMKDLGEANSDFHMIEAAKKEESTA